MSAGLDFNIDLTALEEAMLNGSHGEAVHKAMVSVLKYGEAMDAERLVNITGAPHLVTSFGAGVIEPYFQIIDQLLAEGLKTSVPFTVNPRPVDEENFNYGFLEKLAFRFMYKKQDAYEKQLAGLGLQNKDAFTCACYLPQVGNWPAEGSILAWSESSAVVFANSVLGAKCNRNSAGLDILCNILGKAPYYGLLTDEGRMASAMIELKTDTLPHPQLLGSVIGQEMMEEVPYLVGLREFLGEEMNRQVMDYLKDMGAASAASGAVGLYHAEGLTPEAKMHRRSLLQNNYRRVVIDDQKLHSALQSFPVLWKNANARPQLCFIGCPHLSLEQLDYWVKKIAARLQRSGRKKAKAYTLLCAPPAVIEEYRHNNPGDCEMLHRAGVDLSFLCPLMYLNNPLSAKKTVATNSGKLRTYTAARFLLDEQLLGECIT